MLMSRYLEIFLDIYYCFLVLFLCDQMTDFMGIKPFRFTEVSITVQSMAHRAEAGSFRNDH